MKWTVQLKTIRQMVYAWKASNEIQHCFRQTANFARSTFIFRKNLNWIKKIKITNQNLFEKIFIYKRCILTPFLDSKLERMNLCSYRFKWFKNICCGISRSKISKHRISINDSCTTMQIIVIFLFVYLIKKIARIKSKILKSNYIRFFDNH